MSHSSSQTANSAKFGSLLQNIVKSSIAPLSGIILFTVLWAIVSTFKPALPSPIATLKAAGEIFSHPFYNNGPNDMGIGWNVLYSLKRVGIGFGLAVLVGIPIGFLVGRFKFVQDMMAPIVSLLRPVSPLAWLPIGYIIFAAANPAALWVIFICSIWPVIINTAAGVRQVPVDYLNVARVLNLNEWKVFTKILLPSALPYVLTGIQLSLGVAWLVIVAAEMMSGGTGIGKWIWDEYQASNYANIIVAIFVIGVVGLLIEWLLTKLSKMLTRGENRS